MAKQRENVNETDWCKEALTEKQERRETDQVSDAYTLEHSSECAELWLRAQDETGFRERTQWSRSKGRLHLLKQHTYIYIKTLKQCFNPFETRVHSHCWNLDVVSRTTFHSFSFHFQKVPRNGGITVNGEFPRKADINMCRFHNYFSYTNNETKLENTEVLHLTAMNSSTRISVQLLRGRK